MTLDELKELILAHYDPEDLLEIMQISSEEILDRFEDRVIQYRDTLKEPFTIDLQVFYGELE